MISKKFLLSGNATFTVSNKEGKHYTFNVYKSDITASSSSNPLFFIKVLTGPDNTNDFTYLGMVLESGVKLTRASKYTLDSIVYKVADWIVRAIINDGFLPAGYSVNHAGCCGRCGRKLTTPESIKLGLGPVCVGLS